jgi:hypothetical protein
VKSGNDARFGNFLVESVEVGEPMYHSRHRQRRQCDHWYFVRAKNCCNCAGFGTRPYAMDTRIFGMRWSGIDRLPRGLVTLIDTAPNISRSQRHWLISQTGGRDQVVGIALAS